MKKKILIPTTLAAALTFSAVAFAGEWTTNWDTIESLESFGDDLHVFGLNLAPNPADCSYTALAKVRYTLTTSEKEALALVITSAFLAGREVKVKLDSEACHGGYPIIYGVDVR